uniref:Zf-Tim10_DDP domain-containing protein n=1 Tax=Rhabditophanes sp. KR3021 TaxID=114890 RepID=A0AC35UFF9_9BILA
MAAPPTGVDTDMKTFKDFLIQYNSVSEACFSHCVTDLTSRDVTSKEDKCAQNCLQKFLKMTQRLSTRFAEHQLINAQVQGGNL